ncbi:uncharacterized protein IUM83_12552 [Phytophthora cinnamomi]|uniref:uncharacterized protein n=1 Tax=Phytophthora cinnamomi TaxID=4785 RepID=UPI003559AF5A|nr:hypothetical protein IUM83_12552 [Phytophthora cinnamomi]
MNDSADTAGPASDGGAPASGSEQLPGAPPVGGDVSTLVGAEGDRGATSGSTCTASAGEEAQDTQGQGGGDNAGAPKQGDGGERAPETKGAKPDTAPQDSGNAGASGGKGGKSGKGKPGKARSVKSSRSTSKERSGKSSRSSSKECKRRGDDGSSKRKDSADVPGASLSGVMVPLASSLATMYQGELILRDEASGAGWSTRVMDVHRDYMVRDGFGGLESIWATENLSDSEIQALQGPIDPDVDIRRNVLVPRTAGGKTSRPPERHRRST